MAGDLVQRQIVVGDVRSPVLVGGPAGAGRAEAVVFVHGNPGSASDWRPLMAPVSEHCAVVAPDMPGYGSAEKRRDMDYTVAGYARHLGGVIDALGVRRVHLVAHDFGGPWSLTWAAENVDRIASVSLVNTAILLDYRWHRLARAWRTPVIGELFMTGSIPPVARAVIAHDNPGLDRRWVKHLAGLARPWGTKRAILDLYRSTTREMMDRLVAPLASKDIPCQVIWGTQDVYLPVGLAYRQIAAFPSRQVHLVPGAGHWVWLERPERVIELLLPFLRQHLATSVHSQPVTPPAQS